MSTYFQGCYFCGYDYELCAYIFVDSAIRGYNQYKEIWEVSDGEKKKIFAVSAMKDKEIVHILINSAIITW